MGERTPHASFLAVALHIFNKVVGQGTELLHHCRIGIIILIGADMHPLANKHRLVALKVFTPQAVKKLCSLWIGDIQVIHAETLAAQLRHILGKCKAVGGCVNLGYYLHPAVGSHQLQAGKLPFSVVAVTGRQARIGITLQSEGGVGLLPVAVEEFGKSVIVEVHLQGVHLIVAHDAHKALQILHGYEFATTVNHHATHSEVGTVVDNALRQRYSIGGLAHLQQRAGSPV